MRLWLSGPRILNGLVRPGISLGREDFRPRSLPSWRRYELRHGLQEAAKARGEPMTREDADYAIDKALATGLLDSSGDLNFHAKGTRAEIVTAMLERSAAWGSPMTREQAERKTNAAIRQIWARRLTSWLLWASVIAVIIWAAGEIPSK